MDILKLSQVAQAYYEGLRAPTLVQGWGKYVLTDGENCLFVPAAYEPKEGEAVFYLFMGNRNVCCSLHKKKL